MYGIKVITTDFVANITRFAESRTEETAYSIDLTVTNAFIQAKKNYMILCHRFNSNHILQALFHLRFTSKALLQVIDILVLVNTRTL